MRAGEPERRLNASLALRRRFPSLLGPAGPSFIEETYEMAATTQRGAGKKRTPRQTYTRNVTADRETRGYVGRRVAILVPGQYDLRYFKARRHVTAIHVPTHLETKQGGR